MRTSARREWDEARPKAPPFDTPCIAPWVALEFDPSGWVSACCSSLLYPLGRIGRSRIGDLWDGARARVLKDALLNNDLSVACQACRFHLEHGRMDPVASVYDHYPLESATPEYPHMMLFALSNRCNLGCIMCTPELSSTLRQKAGLPKLESPYDDQFFEDLEPFLPHLGMAKFLGGEPFLVPEHRRIWTMLDQLERPPLLSITTNGTVWTDTVEWVMDGFDVDISVSVDAATPETYAAVRRGGSFADVERNLDRFAERCRSKGRNLHVSFCLMQQNWHELGPFLRWAEPYTFGAPVCVNLVTDAGMALHDLSTDELTEVRRVWDAQDRELSGSLGKNADVWQTQLAQLDAVLAERRAGGAPRPTRAHVLPDRVMSNIPSQPAADPAVVPDRLVAELERSLVAWSGGGDVGRIECDQQGVVVGVPVEHPRLGLNAAALVGSADASIVGVMEQVDGRTAFVIDEYDFPDHSVRSVILATERPIRGVPGTVVRTLHVPHPAGRTILVAEDRLYDDRAVPVTLSRRSSPD